MVVAGNRDDPHVRPGVPDSEVLSKKHAMATLTRRAPHSGNEGGESTHMGAVVGELCTAFTKGDAESLVSPGPS